MKNPADVLLLKKKLIIFLWHSAPKIPFLPQKYAKDKFLHL